MFSPFRRNRLNPVDAGGDVSVQFHLNGFYGLDIYAAPPVSQRIRCSDGIPTGAIQPIQTTVSANPVYNANFDTYSTTWLTRQAWSGTCRRLILRLDDGTTHSLDFSFR